MSEDADAHITAAAAFYRPIILGPPSRLEGGSKLWRQFEAAREAYAAGATDFLPVYERINEMAAAHILLSDTTLAGARVAYEPPVARDGSRIDFAVSMVDGRRLYVEVKSVHPRTDDTGAAWFNYEKRRQHHPKNVHYVVQKDWMGGQIYGNSFSARGAFMTYARQFEERLAAANAVEPGEGVLLACGTGFPWHRSELEDFADFYRRGEHRADDPFAKMEAHALAQGADPFRRNISEIAYLRRAMDKVEPEAWASKVHGPQLGRR
jgi:hypothetical protein